eukprot:scpid39042/ scgid24608/ 
MDTIHRRIIKSKSHILRESVCINEQFLVFLAAEYIAKEGDIEYIKYVGDGNRHRNGPEKVDKALEVVCRGGGKTAFYVLCSALEATKLPCNIQAAELLRAESEAITCENAADDDVEDNCDEMDRHMHRVTRFHRQELLVRARAMDTENGAVHEHQESGLCTSRRKEQINIPVPKPSKQNVINTMRRVQQEKLGILQSEIDRMGRLADLARNCLSDVTNHSVHHDSDRDEAAEDNDRPEQQSASDSKQDARHASRTMPCLLGMSCTGQRDDMVEEEAEQALAYLKWAGAVSKNARVRKHPCVMPVTVVTLEDTDGTLKTFDGQGSVLVKLLADFHDKRKKGRQTLVDHYISELKDALGGSPLHLQGFHELAGKTVLFVQMPGDTLQQLYDLLVHNPGRLSSKTILQVSTVDGATVLSTETTTLTSSSTAHSERSCEDKEQIREILAKVKESADVDIEKIEQTIRRGASFNEVVEELYTMCDDEDTSPSSISAIHSATESTIRTGERYEQLNSLFTTSGTWRRRPHRDEMNKSTMSSAVGSDSAAAEDGLSTVGIDPAAAEDGLSTQASDPSPSESDAFANMTATMDAHGRDAPAKTKDPAAISPDGDSLPARDTTEESPPGSVSPRHAVSPTLDTEGDNLSVSSDASTGNSRPSSPSASQSSVTSENSCCAPTEAQNEDEKDDVAACSSESPEVSSELESDLDSSNTAPSVLVVASSEKDKPSEPMVQGVELEAGTDVLYDTAVETGMRSRGVAIRTRVRKRQNTARLQE